MVGPTVHSYIEYLHEHIIGEHVDCYQAYIGRISGRILFRGTV